MRSDWLQAFLAFSESRNFTRAAEGLHISQPALHVKISKLSDWLGQPLYRKLGRNLVLTPAGERVAAYAREERERSLAFVEELRSGVSRTPVVLCAGTGAYLYLLGPAISAFSERAAWPLRLITGDRDRTVELLLTGEAHLGVTALDAVPDGIVAEELVAVEQVLALPRDHRLAKKRKLKLADLQDQALVVPPQHRPHRIMLNQMLADAGVSWRVAVEAGGWELMLHFAGLGIGLAIVNGCCRLPSGLIAKPLEELPSVRYQVLHRTGSQPHAGVADLRRRLQINRDAWRSVPVDGV